ncbi:ATP-binding protein [Rhodovulum sp. YNF3179]|uniref:ATP-binding protein n=1 Tax=Rhodovulum sp. YNF3179 TaxID=3425127 RepID=UPI003D34FB8A
MVPFDLLVAVCIGYVIFLFLVAFAAERRADAGRLGWLRSPLVYTLSLSVYCTAWTFYGAVGYAARSGLEFMTIYLGPTIVFVGWWWLLRKLVRIGRAQRITSIADLISSRYGKSNLLAVIVTLLAVVGTTPYIALQLQSVTLSFNVFSAAAVEGWQVPDRTATAFWVAAGLTVFTIVFGTRNLDANERHHGVVTAIAVEAVVKLVALLSVGIFVVWGVAGGAGDILDRIDASPIAEWQGGGGRWAPLIFLSAAAVLTLPRMFQVTVVENSDERHLATASWAFPLYLFLMSLFVLPIAVVGLSTLPAGENPDLYVLTLPLAFDREGLAMLAFLGGFSSATSMVIVAAIAVSTMVSNHIVMPLWLRLRTGGASFSGDVRTVVLRARRFSIAGILLLGYTYYSFTGGTEALAAIGLISFAGLAQVLPSLLGGIFWRGATLKGAAAGLVTGFGLWAYTLFLPSFEGTWLMPAAVLAEGPFGIGLLRPRALLGLDTGDPLVHAMIWSLGVNTLLFVGISLVSFPSPMERLQGAQFVNVFQHSSGPGGWVGGSAAAEDLSVMAQRILGPRQAQALFQEAARAQGKEGNLPDPTPDFIDWLERELSGSVGAAAAHAMVGQITGGAAVSVEDLLAVADETAQIMEYSSRLEAKSRELSETAAQLREANDKLTEISIQKDAFLSQISHELRTPMSSIRAFSEILRDSRELGPAQFQRYASIIHDESLRLTRLLDDLLDLSVLENGQVTLHEEPGNLAEILDGAVTATASMATERPLAIRRERSAENVAIYTDCDRLRQVFINLIGNARKYCDAAAPELRIVVRTTADRIEVDFEDNGSGIPEKQQSIIFEKFARLSDQSAAGSAGLGLAICREIMRNLGGSIAYLDAGSGTTFRLTLPRRHVRHAA